MKESTGYSVLGLILILLGIFSLKIGIRISHQIASGIGGGLALLGLYITYIGYEEYKKEQSPNQTTESAIREKTSDSKFLYCPYCGSESTGTPYCPHCGKKV